MKGIIPSLKRASPTILSCIATIGTVATAVLAVRATPKALISCSNLDVEHFENGKDDPTPAEYLKVAWKPYIPAVAVGLGTIVCILSANGLNRKQQATITSAYVLLENAYKEYKNKLKDIYGEETDTEVRKAVAKDNYTGDPDVTDGKLLFYDEYSNRYFERTMEEVIDAEYHLNREFILEGDVKLNKFYELLGLPGTELGAVVGWDCESAAAFFGYQWIDFEHDLVVMDDGLECYIVHMPFAPTREFA